MLQYGDLKFLKIVSKGGWSAEGEETGTRFEVDLKEKVITS